TGKTTLLRLISGQILPDSGHIYFNHTDVTTLSRSGLYKIRKKNGVMFQSNALFTNLSVYDNVAYPLRENQDFSESFIHSLVLMKLQAVGLRGARDLMPSDLSGGMARRVALARAIAMDPELILYDEPFTGQDPISVGMIVKLMRLLNKSANMTSVIVSHDIEILFNLVDYAFVLADGKLIGQGKPSELRQSQNPQVEQFLQGLPDGPVPFHYPAKDYLDDLMGDA
ncbi:MAG: ATP-binding cassette domain-containing protein, partial [Gammaproteobacteria bacterium]|nr:ATP-binding cassette domain-containing protein [Gammaproteobacteria bacterium]